jgi:hypothetical protein
MNGVQETDDPWDEYDRLLQAASRWALRIMVGVPLTAGLGLAILHWSRLVAVFVGVVAALVGTTMAMIGTSYGVKGLLFAHRSRQQLLAGRATHVARSGRVASRRDRAIFVPIMTVVLVLQVGFFLARFLIGGR